MSLINEAFKSLDMLEEDAFDVSSDGIEELKAFKDGDIQDDADSVEIFDTEAETEDDIKDSYIGKVITDCCVCHSKFYNNEEDIQIDDESGLANVTDECAFCGSTEGFTIIGKVMPFEPTQDIESDVDDDIDIDFEDDNVDDTNELGESLDKECDDKCADDEECVDGKCEPKDTEIKESISKVNKHRKIVTERVNTHHRTPMSRKMVESKTRRQGKRLSEMQVTYETPLERFNFWRGAYDTAKYLTSDDFKTIESILEMEYPNGINETDLNDIFWFECDIIAEWLGYEDFDDLMDDRRGMHESCKNSRKCKSKRTNKRGTKNESVNITIDDDTNIDIASTSDTSINVGTTQGGDEMIAPLDDTDIDTIENNGDDTSLDLDGLDTETTNDEETQDIDITDIDEETIDSLGESYLKSVYENVASYKTRKVSKKGNTLCVEGVIRYNSGKKSTTRFTFEAHKIDKNGKVHFLGENRQFTRKKGIFDLQGSVNGGKFVCEKLNYNYKVNGTLVEGVQRLPRKRINELFGKKKSKYTINYVDGNYTPAKKEGFASIEDAKKFISKEIANGNVDMDKTISIKDVVKGALTRIDPKTLGDAPRNGKSWAQYDQEKKEQRQRAKREDERNALRHYANSSNNKYENGLGQVKDIVDSI